jgi:hypothetical protein
MKRTRPAVAVALFAVATCLLGCSGKVTGDDAGANAPPPSCAATCARFVDAGCPASYMSQADCEAECGQALSKAEMQSCAQAFDAVLSCAETTTLRCLNGELDPGTCGDASAALDRCENPPALGCEAIPPSVGGSTCSSPTGAPGSPEQATTCTDGAHNTYTATCSGSTCTCGYDGRIYCTCESDGGGRCCPGVF